MAGFLLAAWRRPSGPPLSFDTSIPHKGKTCTFFAFGLDNIDIRAYTEDENNDIRYKGVRAVPRAKFQTLTEQMYYILLCLSRENCGMDVMDQIPAMTGGRVRVGPGTLYNLLEQFVEAEMIRETRCEGRRRSYILTEKGRARLDEEYRRICQQQKDYEAMFREEGTL